MNSVAQTITEAFPVCLDLPPDSLQHIITGNLPEVGRKILVMDGGLVVLVLVFFGGGVFTISSSWILHRRRFMAEICVDLLLFLFAGLAVADEVIALASELGDHSTSSLP